MKNIERLSLSVVAAIICLIPLWIFVAVKSLLHPTGFWQNLVTYGVGVYFLGGIQIILLIVFICAIAVIWMNLDE